MTARERWISIAGVIIALSLLVAVGIKEGFSTDTMASWVQAVGSIGAILFVTVPVTLQHRMERARSREVVLAAAEMSFGLMSAVADRYLEPDRPTPEWWVPQWQIYDASLAAAPIHATGSADALRAFVEFRELFHRAEAFADPPPNLGEGGLEGFVAYTMTNAADRLSRLREALRERDRGGRQARA